ncbi:unnamed protein product [Brassica oleracea]
MENKNQEEALIIEVSTITYIDLASSDLHQSSVLLKQACSDSGFFCHKSWYKRGIERPRFRAEQEVLHPSFGREDEGDYKEGFTIGTEGPKKGPHHDKTLYSPNIWPNPDVLPRWWETMEKYYQKALRVCKSIARIMALALDLDVNYFDTPDMLRNPIADMILFHCEGVSNPSKGIYACGAHCDFGMLSLLATDDVMGLQICKDKDLKPQKWKYVPSIKGAYIVNLGNLLERWSNGFYKSTLHWVLGNGQDRYSFPFFLKPSHDCIIECLPTCQSENKPPKYPAIKCSTYLSQHYKAAHTHHKQT